MDHARDSNPAPQAVKGADAQGAARQVVPSDGRGSGFFETVEAESARDPVLLMRLQETLQKFGAPALLQYMCSPHVVVIFDVTAAASSRRWRRRACATRCYSCACRRRCRSSVRLPFPITCTHVVLLCGRGSSLLEMVETESARDSLLLLRMRETLQKFSALT